MTINEVKKAIENSKRIAVLSGAGMSTESGLPDFRSVDGIYNTLTTAMTFNIWMFRIWPRRFYSVMGRFYQEFMEAKPNAGHYALAELEKMGKKVEIVTQNVDCLHQEAGSTKVHQIHGTIETLFCSKCKKHMSAKKFGEIFSEGKVARCPVCGKVLKPDLVFFGESLPYAPMRHAKLAFLNSDLVLILGTSLRVSPANSLPGLRVEGTPMIIINQDPTPYDEYADFVSHKRIGEILPKLIGLN